MKQFDGTDIRYCIDPSFFDWALASCRASGAVYLIAPNALSLMKYYNE